MIEGVSRLLFTRKNLSSKKLMDKGKGIKVKEKKMIRENWLEKFEKSVWCLVLAIFCYFGFVFVLVPWGLLT